MLFPRIFPVLAIMHFAVGEACALGFANGLKIGEPTDQSVVLWTRLTADSEPSNQAEKWTTKNPNWTVPGASGQVAFEYWKSSTPEKKTTTLWLAAVSDHDSCVQVKIGELSPSTGYGFRVLVKDSPVSITGEFTTAPPADSKAPLTFAVSTCQEFELRDDPAKGHRIYQSMLALKPAFFVQTGDTLYYDRHEPFATNITLARYRWGQMYGLPFQKEFHRHIPTYWMHDDHDLLKNDCWPGQSYGDLTWEQGLAVWHEQIPQSDKPYRTFRWGKDLQIWLPEGREYRSPNNMPDGPDKSILGKEQWAWLETSMKSSDATFKLYISATPVVGPDRKGKKDNHANEGFEYEGKRLRGFLNRIPGCFVINGDRHWQYHSKDPETHLHEFGCGPASDAHAQGFSMNDQEPWQDFLRIKGGFLTVSISPSVAIVNHYTVDGSIVHTTKIPAP